MTGSQQEATKFEVKIRINEKESFRPGMSVTAEIETRREAFVAFVRKEAPSGLRALFEAG